MLLFWSHLGGVWSGSGVAIIMWLTNFFWIFNSYPWVIGKCICCSINMGDKIRGVVWCSSGIFSFCFYGGLWPGQVECVPSSPKLEYLNVRNHHHQVLKLEPLEVWYHGALVLVLVYVVLLPVPDIPVIAFFVSIDKLCIMFLSVL